MEVKKTYKKKYQTIGILACIGLIFSWASIIKAFNEAKIYNARDSNVSITPTSNLWAEIVKARNTRETNELIKQQEYEKALQNMSWSQGEDYYNRWTLQTLMAYTYALESNISWLENAKIRANQAQQNFDIAQKLADSQEIKKASRENAKTIAEVGVVITIKNCYGVGQGIVMNINTIIDTNIKGIKDALITEKEYIDKRKNTLSPICYEKLQYIVDASKEQVGELDLQMKKNRIQYISDLSDKIRDPILCIKTPYENIIPSLLKGQEWLEIYALQHQNTIAALKSNTSKSIQELCNQSGNDAAINQKIESSVQELLQKLQDNTTENNLSSKEQQRASKEIKYQDFFNQDEQKILQEIEKTNQWWIKNTLDIRGKWNYTPERYINDMFNEFYGSSGDFIDLHK